MVRGTEVVVHVREDVGMVAEEVVGCPRGIILKTVAVVDHDIVINGQRAATLLQEGSAVLRPQARHGCETNRQPYRTTLQHTDFEISLSRNGQKDDFWNHL